MGARFGAVSASAGEGRVLPRPMRRVVRFVVSLCSGRVAIPAHAGKLSLAGFYSAVALCGIVVGGHGPAVVQAVTTGAGFAVEDIHVSGNEHTSEIDILQLLGLDGSTSLLGLDIASARAALAGLPWVESAEVRKVYPRAVEVVLRERQAYGIWQHGTELSLIEKSGSVIAPLRDNKYSSLPLFVGRDAETAAAAVEADFSKFPQIASRVKAFVRIAGRRWDIHLDNGVVVKLPEEGIAVALEKLSRLDAEEQLLSRDITAVDLRLPDRTAIQLTPEAQARRLVKLEERRKMLKKAGVNI
ncbi:MULTISPECIES: cell division protein FtsQ/DivIB [Alphaproteobacteria]|uniref:Cell division protein FtsQ n=2 Tax=Alphaproteobacteria TaxID=28211 RepID=A0A512HEA3_9HYPH|nr:MULTISPECIES: cell division protein FtsQ/DivIB [Alphaproteobacteria]GEO83788.1 cell division protein FtsQ [Ciceribacter naphthalenivorans]GLR21334.1 cell division protein FtsQ [Ciceribacter naphthalenivorans]GLT04190.1 cell division protein FtsQ [Sphingomonas psychrolutea]